MQNAFKKSLNPAKILWLSLAAVIGVAGFVLISFANKYAPVILVRDRWASLDPLFYHYNFWQGFTFQHGPHRMGLAYILFRATAGLSDWNSRWDMFLQAGIYILCALMALRLKFLIFKKLSWTDLLIPLIFITLQSAITVTINPYVHGLIPFFALSVALSYFIKHDLLRFLSLSGLSFVALFSGFALVVGLIFLSIEVIALLKSGKWNRMTLLFIPLAGLIYFLITQHPSESIALSQNWLYNFRYWLLLSGNYLFYGVGRWVIPLGTGAVFSVCLLIFLNRNYLFGQNSPHHNIRAKVIWLLIGSTFLFNILCLAGRADTGIQNALASRYIPAAMPFILGVYFLILLVRTWGIKIICLILFSLIIMRFQLKTQNRTHDIVQQYPVLTEWGQCLRAGNSYDNCLGEMKYPLLENADRVAVPEKINFLRRNRLNVFREK